MTHEQITEYKHKWAKRPVWLERGLDVTQLESSVSIFELCVFRVRNPCSPPFDCVLNFVCEFYMGLDVFNIFEGSIFSGVHGEMILITIDDIAGLLGIPVFKNAGYPYPPGVPRVSNDVVTSIFFLTSLLCTSILGKSQV